MGSARVSDDEAKHDVGGIRTQQEALDAVLTTEPGGVLGRLAARIRLVRRVDERVELRLPGVLLRIDK